MIELFMVVAYFIITTAAGKIMNGKGDNSIQHFFVAKKHLGIGLTVALMFGEMVAGSSTVGNAASAFKMGLFFCMDQTGEWYWEFWYLCSVRRNFIAEQVILE